MTGPPPPPPAVVAAIVAAVDACWPRPAPTPEAPPPSPAWRFSGRWWTLPVPVRRDRPWATR
ncbi:MAG: hypothetical protein ACRD0L_11505 [Acidimicrobiales bacterium]